MDISQGLISRVSALSCAASRFTKGQQIGGEIHGNFCCRNKYVLTTYYTCFEISVLKKKFAHMSLVAKVWSIQNSWLPNCRHIWFSKFFVYTGEIRNVMDNIKNIDFFFNQTQTIILYLLTTLAKKRQQFYQIFKKSTKYIFFFKVKNIWLSLISGFLFGII